MNLSWIPWIGGALGVAILVAFCLHIKHQADLVPALQNQVKTYQTSLDTANKNTRTSEDLRRKEKQQSIQALSDAETSCEARIAEARRSAGKIRTITHAVVKYDANHCPKRMLLDPNGLRDALGALK